MIHRQCLNTKQFIFSLNSILAWAMKTDAFIQLIRKWSMDYIKMECEEDGKCYGVLAVSASGSLAYYSTHIGI